MKCCIKSGMTCVAACGAFCGHCSNGERIDEEEFIASDEQDTN